MAASQAAPATPAALRFDLRTDSVRELNRRLHGAEGVVPVVVANPDGRHSIAVGLDAPWDVEVEGHVGYYCAGMNQLATIRVHGNCGVGQPGCRRNRSRRAARHPWRRVGALRHLPEGG